MKKFFSIYDKVFRQEYCWVNASSSSEFDKLLRTKVADYDQQVELGADGEDDDTDGETISLKTDHGEVIFFWFNKKDATVIVHELLHAIFICMRSRGIALTEASEESFCYVLSYLYGEILKELNKKKNLTK
jgi:hypothetical protein